ncbi:unnamed protein product [Rotaria sp. Silwood2]|nr:unnamed protein product [Rotaria sp. Silwood2]CAF2912864.1 unnamed protein product [Rotaria sp. Silwood2]CAF3274472.1 unnamed protein product [Rotaria sp. Silwood2]CAF4039966.1 unnamed protein product [Rotaria sp. Silwood2]
MKIDPSTPFTNIGGMSHIKGEEEEILFSMHFIFCIEPMQHIDGNDRLWQVDLPLASDNDLEIHALTEQIAYRDLFSEKKMGSFR